MEGEFRLLDGAALSRVYRDHVRRDFPPAERKPLQAMERMRRIGRYDPLGYYSGEKLLGYAFLWRDRAGEYVLLDYLAVCPEGRGQGTGTAMLEGLNARYRRCRAILAEAEAVGEDAAPEENALRLRRLRFYRRAGFRDLGWRVRLFGVWYTLLASGPAAPDAALEGHRGIYAGEGALMSRLVLKIRYEKE